MCWIIGGLLKIKEAITACSAKVRKEGKPVKDFKVMTDFIYKNYDPARVIKECEKHGSGELETKRKLDVMEDTETRSTRAKSDVGQSDAGSGDQSEKSGKK